ncbi:PTS system mannose/fructose/N-acetylgalactosamine-transporter subunit IIB [Candidatus Latescibacterota bacterium]
MPIILTRIDDRLIHGQVTEGWGRSLKADYVLVVSDSVAGDEWECDICLAALPGNIKGEVVDVAHAPEAINRLLGDDRSSYVLFESPEDACRAVYGGANLREINVGGLHSSKGKREIIDYIYVDDNDSQFLKALQDAGVELDFRDLPDNTSVDVMALL